MATKTAIKSTKKSTNNTKTVSTAAAKASAPAMLNYNAVCQTFNDKPMVGVMVAEFVGAFLLTASFLEMQGNPLFFAFALAGVVFIVGGASGAHLNPAVTFGAWVTRKMDWMKALGYIVAQLLGAGLAFLVLNTFLHANESAASTTSLYHAASITNGKEWYIFFAELLGSTVLVLGAATALRAKKGKTVAALAYGFAALIAFYVAMSLTTVLLTESGVSLTFLNPAVAMAANGLSWKMWPLAIYILAPILGGVIGFFIADVLHCQNADKCNCELCK